MSRDRDSADGANPTPRIVDNADEKRYELWVGDARAGVIEYDTQPGVVALIHTEVDPAFEGRGLATKLIADAIEDIRARGLKLVPVCPFVRAYLQRHPEDRDLVVTPPLSDRGRARAVSGPRPEQDARGPARIDRRPGSARPARPR